MSSTLVRTLRGSVGFVPVSLLLALSLFWAARGGEVSSLGWYPGAVFAVLLAAAVMVASGQAVDVPRPVAVAVALFAGLVVWTYASITWSDDREAALDGANRTLLYLAVIVVAVRFAWRSGALLACLTLYSAGVAVLGLVTLWSAAHAQSPESFFVAGRLASPMGYQNANAALFLMAFWAPVTVATSRDLPLLLRSAAAGAAALLLGIALLCQSRGSLGAFPVSAVIYVLLTRSRLRTLLFLAVPVAACAAASPTLLHVYTAVVDASGEHAALRSALLAVVVSTAAVALVVGLLAWSDRRVVVSDRARRVIGITVAAVAAVALASGGALAARADGQHALVRGWHEFVGNEVPSAGTSHFGAGLGSNRYDFWRVAWGLFVDHPIGGVGSDNFAIQYLEQRRSQEEPIYPHSLELRALSQTGVVGTALLAGAMGLLFAAALRARRSLGSFGAAVSAASLGLFFYWLVHGSVDWFWEFPSLSLPALVGLACAARLDGSGTDEAQPRRRRLLLRAAVAVAAAVGVAAMVLPWLSAQETASATAGWGAHPQKALSALGRARRLNPLSETPDLTRGSIYALLHDWPAMDAAFGAAEQRTPKDWYAHFERAIALAHLGQPRVAARELAVARSLDPREPTIGLVAARLHEPKSLDPAAINEIFLSRAAAIVH